MKLYLSPGACSLASHIALHEAGLDFVRVKVDLKTRRTDDGRDYLAINPKGYVPALELDDGAVLTENIAILSWIADHAPALSVTGALARYRQLELLAYISTEIHKPFKPFFKPNADPEDKTAAAELIAKRLDLIATRLTSPYLFDDKMTVADAYLFVMLTWMRKNSLPLADPLPAYFQRMAARPAVKLSLEHEGLADEPWANAA